MATKSPEEAVKFLLLCIECGEISVNFDKVAASTGYKNAKSAKKAFGNVQKKFGGDNIVNDADNGGGGEKTNVKKRKATKDDKKPTKKTKKQIQKKADEESEDEKHNKVAGESEDGDEADESES